MCIRDSGKWENSMEFLAREMCIRDRAIPTSTVYQTMLYGSTVICKNNGENIVCYVIAVRSEYKEKCKQYVDWIKNSQFKTLR